MINKMRKSVMVFIGMMMALLAGSCQVDPTTWNARQKWSKKTQ
jgi:hypothetical protein